MIPRSVSWWIAVILLIVVGFYVRLEPAGRGMTTRDVLQDITWSSGSWRCEAAGVGEAAYTDPIADAAWSGVCVRDDLNRLSVYVGYVGEQGHDRRLASPRLQYPGNDERWSYLLGRPREIRLTDGDRLPLRVNETLLQYSNGRQDAVLYWYQRGPRTFSDEYRFRISLIVQKLTRHPTDAAIVRIATSLDARGMEAAFQSERDLAPWLYGALMNRIPWN